MPTSAGACAICGTILPPHSGRGRKRKICDKPSCRRAYKTHKQREYTRNMSPEQVERRRARARDSQRENNAKKLGKRNSSQWNLKHVHGMTPEQWHAMFVDQQGTCYLCERPLLPDISRKVVVEHDHSHCGPDRSCSTCRRGLACSNCNAIIGMAGENPQRLRVIADNLERQAMVTRALIIAAPQQGLLSLSI